MKQVIKRRVEEAYKSLKLLELIYGWDDEYTKKARAVWGELDRLWKELYGDEEYNG